MQVRIRLVNNTLQNGIGGSALDAFNAAFGGFDFPLVSGDNVISTTTVFFPLGQYNWDLKVEVPNKTFLIGSFLPDSVLIATTSLFYVVAPTGLDVAMASTSDVLISSLVTGTTTQSVLRCNPVNFDITVCAISLIVPSSSVVQSDFETFRDDVLRRAPIGYITRFATILLSTGSSSLPVFSATIPNGVIGAGSSLTLDLNHSLDYILNATTSSFNNASATSTDTFYNITSFYWNIVVYLGFLFYILKRVLGKHLIPKLDI